jgi:hypothetical protein
MGASPINNLNTGMNTIEMYYYYLFYKIYSLMEFFKSNGIGNKFRSIILISFLEMWLVFGLYNYWDLITNQHSIITLFSIRSVPFIFIFILKWVAFIRNDTWKDYKKEFDDWPKEKNSKGSTIVIFITVLIVLNSIISTYL